MVLATGALEQPLVFCNNDRPGVMLAGAVHEYLRRYAVAPGRRVLVDTDLRDEGVAVVAIADSRRDIPEPLLVEMRTRSITGVARVDAGRYEWFQRGEGRIGRTSDS